MKRLRRAARPSFVAIALAAAAGGIAPATAGAQAPVRRSAVTPVPTAAPTPAPAVMRADASAPLVAPTGLVRAYTLTDPSQMVPGVLADGFPGDLVLENDTVKAIVGRPGRKALAGVSGGNLLDLVCRVFPLDHINSVQTAADLDSTTSQVAYDSADAPSTAGGTTATVTVRGGVPTLAGAGGAPGTRLDVTTTYSLAANDDRLSIRTRFTNNTTGTLDIAPGDTCDWGTAVTFLPGVGAVGAPTDFPAAYAVASGDAFSVAYVQPGPAPLTAVHSPRQSVIQAIALPRRPDDAAGTAAAAPKAAGTPAPRIAPPPRLAPPAPDFVEPPYMPNIVVPRGQETRYATGVSYPSSAPRVESAYRPETAYRPAGLGAPAAAATTSTAPRDGRPAPGGDGDRTAAADVASTSTAASAVPTPAAAKAIIPGVPRPGGRIALAPGQSFEFERLLVVSNADFARLEGAAARLKGAATGLIAGLVVEAGTDAPLAGAEVLVSGGAGWNRRSAAPAFTKTVTKADGTFAMRLPAGEYLVQPVKQGRAPAAPPASATVKPGEAPVVLPLALTRESILRVTTTEAESATSVPVPAKITFQAKPGTPPADWGFGPGIDKGIKNVHYMPLGGARIPITPGRYVVTVSRGIEYDIERGEVTVPAGSDQRLEFSMKHSLKGQLPGLVSMDAGVMTTASAIANASPLDRVVQAACEGVQVIVTGDYGVATDLTPEIERLGLQDRLKCFPGMRLLLEKDGLAADLLAYPLSRDTATSLAAAAKAAAGLPPDVALSDLRRGFPGVVFQIDQPSDPQQGYLTPFEFDEAKLTFKDGVTPPPDFDAIQVVDGKKQGNAKGLLPRLFALSAARTREAGSAPLSGLAGSHSRLAAGEELGYPRVYLRTPNDTLDRLKGEDIVKSVKAQRYLVSNGPVMTVTVMDPKTGKFDVMPGDVVDHSSTGTMTVKINIVAAPWVSMSNFDVNINGQPVDRTEVMPTTRVLRYPIQADPASANRRRQLDEDSLVEGICFGTRRPLSPVVPTAAPDFGGENYPFAWTGPIFVDANGDGKVVIAPKKN